MILSYHAVPTEEEMFFIGSTLEGGFLSDTLEQYIQVLSGAMGRRMSRARSACQLKG